MQNKYVVIRSKNAGAFVAQIQSRDGSAIIANNCRRLWYWSGAASLSQLAVDGVSNPKDCKFSVPTNGHEILDVIEIIPMTDRAVESVSGVPEWKA